MELRYVKTHPAAKAPSNSKGNAGWDIHSCEDIIINPGERVIVNTGICMAIPQGVYGEIKERSGLAAKNGIAVMGGVIDSSYRGEVKVILRNTSLIKFLLTMFRAITDKGAGTFQNLFGLEERYQVKAGDRIAQIVFQKYESPELVEVTSLDETDRGEKGFGSSGA